jgi:hypothetical protein
LLINVHIFKDTNKALTTVFFNENIEQLTLPENMSSPRIFSRLRVARSLVFRVMFCMFPPTYEVIGGSENGRVVTIETGGLQNTTQPLSVTHTIYAGYDNK